MRVGSGSFWPVCAKKPASCGTITVMKMMMSPTPATTSTAGYTSACCTRSRSAFTSARYVTSRLQDRRQRAARLAGGDHVDIKRREDVREIAHRLGKAAAIHQRLVQRAGKRVELRVLQPPHEDAERFIERHPRAEQVAELLGEKKLLRKRQRERGAGRFRARGVCRSGSGNRSRGFFSAGCGRAARHRLDFDGEKTLLLDLRDRRRAVVRFHHALHQLPLGAAGGVAKLRHEGEQNWSRRAPQERATPCPCPAWPRRRPFSCGSSRSPARCRARSRVLPRRCCLFRNRDRRRCRRRLFSPAAR